MTKAEGLETDPGEGASDLWGLGPPARQESGRGKGKVLSSHLWEHRMCRKQRKTLFSQLVEFPPSPAMPHPRTRKDLKREAQLTTSIQETSQVVYAHNTR